MNFFAATILLFSVVSVTAGTALIYVPAGFIIGGLFLGVVGVLSINVSRE